MAPPGATSKTRMILATLDLLRGSGLSGAGINQVVTASGAPKGSVYHFFPAGKHALVAAALYEAEHAVGEGLRAIFSRRVPLPHKIRRLFETTAARLHASRYLKGCPVAAVTLDIDDDAEALRAICWRVFITWRDIIATGLHDVPPSDRRDVAQLILAALEGAMVLARAHAMPEPLERTGALLATTLGRAGAQPLGPRRRPRRQRPRQRRSRR
jgi:TetR/AcrR family transcriptional repressor of lmrAB and yxaGH operons